MRQAPVAGFRPVAAWLAIDPRALAAYRLAMGTLVMLEVLRRAPVAMLFFSREGIVAAPAADVRHTFTLLEWLDRTPYTEGFFVFAFVCALLFTLGWHTRVFHLLTWLCVISWNSDRFPTANTGGLVMQLTLMWTLFLPLGRCWSLDARGSGGNRTEPVWGLAVLAIWLQLATIYAFNTIEKWGPIWMNGEAIHYLLQLDTHVTWLGAAIRDGFPMWLGEAMTYGALLIEMSAPVLILSPLRPTALRRTAAVLLVSLHIGIAMLGHVGIFSAVMLATFTLLLWPVPHGDRPRWGRPRLALDGFIAFLIVVNTFQALKSHDTTRQFAKALDVEIPAPELFRDIVYFGGMTQRWRLFAPNVPAGEGRLVLSALTDQGKRVDPLTDRPPDFGPARFGVHVGNDQFWRKYTNRVAGDATGRQAEHLGRWLLANHRTPPPDERRLSEVEVWYVYDRSPQPGTSGPGEVISRKRLVHVGIAP